MQKEIDNITERNKRVESDKAWETSKTRKIIITILIYFIIVIFLIFINAPNPWLNALVPPIGFLLYTITFPLFKRIWINKLYLKK